MSAAIVRPAVPLPFRRGAGTPQSVEALLVTIVELAAERQELRGAQATCARLELNRLELARAQWELSHALIARYLPDVPPPA